MNYLKCLLVCCLVTPFIALAQTKPPAKPTAPVKAVPVSPISLDPINPHYLRFRGRPVVLITSGEHYGAVLNADFDYVKYLDTLHDSGLNLARIFNGTYVEPLDTLMFPGGDQNTLAPRTGRYLAPWARTGQPGYAGGGRKFDLSRWDEDYFARLKAFITEAGKRGIAVELTLFSTNYGSGKIRWGAWNLSPFNAANNINGLSTVTWDRFNTLEDKALVAAQDALVKKTVESLNSFDNLYYEVCNEPWFSGAGVRETTDWLNHMIGVIQSAEARLPNKHLIADNVPADHMPGGVVNPAVSIYNFHSGDAVSAVNVNWILRKPVALDATSNGCSTLDRRREVWTFLLSGGAIYDNLDLSFATDDPVGKGDLVHCEGLRYNLRLLAGFINGLDLAHVQPDHTTVTQWAQFGSEIHVLGTAGKVYAIYLKGGNDARSTTLLLDLPPGRYQAEWLNPRTGDPASDMPVEHPGGALKISTPEFNEDLAVKLVRVGDLPPSKPPILPKTPARVEKKAPEAARH